MPPTMPPTASVTRVVSGTAIFEGDYARRSSQVLGSILNLCQECMCDVAQVTFRTSFSSAPIGHVSISKVEYKDTTTMGGMGLMAFIIPESVTTRGASIAVCRSPWQVSTNLWVTSAAYTFFGR